MATRGRSAAGALSDGGDMYRFFEILQTYLSNEGYRKVKNSVQTVCELYDG